MTSGPNGIDSNSPIPHLNSPDLGSTKAFDHTSSSNAGGFSKFREMLGEDGYKKFLSIIANMVSSKMQKEAAKMKQSEQKLKKALLGEDSD